MAGYAEQWAEFGVQAIGACCGSTPETIQAIGDVVDGHRSSS
jgi:methionine synthase I (cobalamin-dependent)